MKKIALFITIITLMFSSINFNISASSQEADSDSTQISTDTYARECGILNALGIFTDAPSNPLSNVTRAAFVAGVTELIGASGTYEPNKSPFYDVKSTDSYYNEILVAAQMGIVNGDENRNFNPNTPVTYLEGVVMVLKALGYNETYPSGYLNVAQKLRLTKGISRKTDENLTTGECAKLLVNAGDTVPYRYGSYENGSFMLEDETLFYSVHKVSKKDGVMTANEVSSLTSTNGVGKGKVIIDNEVYKLYDAEKLYDFLGYNVEIFYKEIGGEAVILYIDKLNNKTKTVDADDIMTADAMNVSYMSDNSEKKISFPKDAAILYNGVLTLKYTDEKGESIFMPKIGNITFIDNNNDSVYDVVSITSCKNLIVSSVDTNNMIISNMYYPTEAIDLGKLESDDSLWTLTDGDGKRVELSSLEKYDVITYAESMDKKTFRGILNRKTAEGVVEFSGEESPYKVVTINDVKYEIDRFFEKSGEVLPNIGDNVVALLDSAGRIAGIKSKESNSVQYGFYIQSAVSGDDFYKKIRVKIMDSVGKGGTMEYEMADKVKIDGVIYDDRTYSGAENRNLYDYVKVPDGYSRTKQNIQNNNEQFLEPFQVVVFKLDSESKICYIDTQRKRDEYEDEYTLTKISSDNYEYSYVRAGYHFYTTLPSDYSLVAIGTDTRLIGTPQYADKEDYFAYKCYKRSDADFFSTDQRQIFAYTTNPKSSIPEVIHIPFESNKEINNDSVTALVKDITQSITPEGEISYLVNYFSDLREYSYYAEPGINLSDIKNGDIIKLELNSANKINKVEKFCEYNKDTSEISFASLSFSIDNVHHGSTSKSYVGYNYGFEGDTLMFAKDMSHLGRTEINTLPIISVYAGIYRVRQSRNGCTVEKISFDDIAKIQNYRDSNVKTAVYVRLASAVPRMLVFYEGQ